MIKLCRADPRILNQLAGTVRIERVHLAFVDPVCKESCSVPNQGLQHLVDHYGAVPAVEGAALLSECLRPKQKLDVAIT